MAVEVVIAVAFVNVVPKNAATATAMGETGARIEMYFQGHNRFPPERGVLPEREGFVKLTMDAWERPLIYKPGTDDSFIPHDHPTPPTR